MARHPLTVWRQGSMNERMTDRRAGKDAFQFRLSLVRSFIDPCVARTNGRSEPRGGEDVASRCASRRVGRVAPSAQGNLSLSVSHP